MRAVIVSIVCFAWAGWLQAAEISKHANDSPTLNAIAFRGEIVEGDAFRLKSYISKLPMKKTTAIYLESPGGLFMEGMDIGRFLHRAGIRTVTEGRAASCLIPTVIDQNPFTHCRRPIDMMFHGRSWSVLQA